MMATTQEEYETREARLLQEQIAECERAPLSERRLAKIEWLQALIAAADNPMDDCLIACRLEWLFQGSYGKGAYDRAHSIVRQKQGNRTVALGQLLAVVEWQCPNTEARAAWNLLTDEAKRKVTAVVQRAIDIQGEATV